MRVIVELFLFSSLFFGLSASVVPNYSLSNPFSFPHLLPSLSSHFFPDSIESSRLISSEAAESVADRLARLSSSIQELQKDVTDAQKVSEQKPHLNRRQKKIAFCAVVSSVMSLDFWTNV